MEENGCGGGALRREWGKKRPKNEQSEEHGKSLVPKPRVIHSKKKYAQTRTCTVYPKAHRVLKANQKVVINVISWSQEES